MSQQGIAGIWEICPLAQAQQLFLFGLQTQILVDALPDRGPSIASVDEHLGKNVLSAPIGSAGHESDWTPGAPGRAPTPEPANSFPEW